MTAVPPSPAAEAALPPGRLTVKNAADRFELVLWVAALITSPFYFMPSGLPQASDFILALCSCIVLVRRSPRWPGPLVRLVAPLGAFTAYVTLVDLFWGAKESSGEIATNALFYLFNGVGCLTAVTLYVRNGSRFLKMTAVAVGVSVLLQAALSLAVLDLSRGRQVLFFNNPNQLGYYSVLSLCLFSLANVGRSDHRWRGIGTYAAGVYLAMLSLSKAALASTGLFLLSLLGRRPLALLMAVAVLGGGLFLAKERFPLMTNVAQRVAGASEEGDDTLAQRGYDRIVNHPQYLILGAGEGLTARFDSVLHGEIHSTFATLLFSYGIVGGLLFLWLQFVLFSAAPMAYLNLVPPFLYGITHNGLRDTFLWISFAFVAARGEFHRAGRRGRA